MNIIEIDGPPMAYIETPNGPNIYKTIGITGDDPVALVLCMDKRISQIKKALSTGIVYWRKRPTFYSLGAIEGCGCHHRLLCRVTTSPVLSEEFWADLGIKAEGADFEVVTND